MLTQNEVVDAIVRDFNIDREALVKESLRSFLEKRLREASSEFYALTRKYAVAGVEEMEHLYSTGALEEELTREDYQRLDHLEYKKNELDELLRALQ